MSDPVAISISVLALSVSATTAWLTLFRRGTVMMTQPTVIFFGWDTSRSKNRPNKPKVFLRTLLIATSKRGRVIESMHASLRRNETQQNFNIWVHGDEKLVRGSGLFVGETGVGANHHFLAPEDETSFIFRAGRYRLEVYARLLGNHNQKLMFAQELEIAPHVAVELAKPRAGLYFDWSSDSSTYVPHVDVRDLPDAEMVEAMLSGFDGKL